MFFRVFKFAGQNFRRNIWLSLATTFVMVITLVSFNLLLILNVVGGRAVEIMKDRIDVSVYFKPEASDELVLSARSALASQDAVRDVQFVGRDLALENFRKRHEDDAEIIATLDELGGNPLGASLIIKARDPSRYAEILGALDNPNFRDYILEKSFEDHRLVIDKLMSISRKVERGALAISLIFTLLLALIVINSVRVAVYTRREEIGIMKLVGASNGFIRAPFFIEAMFAGLLAFAITALILIPSLSGIQPFIAKFFGSGAIDLAAYFKDNGFKILAAELATAILLPMGIAGAAVSRYLKV